MAAKEEMSLTVVDRVLRPRFHNLCCFIEAAKPLAVARGLYTRGILSGELMRGLDTYGVTASEQASRIMTFVLSALSVAMENFDHLLQGFLEELSGCSISSLASLVDDIRRECSVMKQS